MDLTKPWTKSLTIWATVVTFLSTVAPALAALMGWNISAGDVQTVGNDVTTVLQAVGGLVGTILAIYGRVAATKVISSVKSS